MAGMRVVDEAVELLFELAALLDRQIVEEALRAGEDDHDLLFERQRLNTAPASESPSGACRD